MSREAIYALRQFALEKAMATCREGSGPETVIKVAEMYLKYILSK